jgi:hypothetical protein
VAGDTSGSVTLSAPAVAGTTTLTLPTNTGNIPVVSGTGTSGQVLTSGGSGAVSTWATPASGAMTLLGTVNTTSGTSQTLSGLTLTSYKQLYITMSGVTMSTSGYLTYSSSALRISNNIGSTNIVYGVINQDLTTGVYSNFGAEQTTDPTYASGIIAYLDIGQTIHAIAGRTNLTTASTSVTIGCSAGTLTAGSFTVYGVK